MGILPNVRPRQHVPMWDRLERPSYPRSTWQFEAHLQDICIARILREAALQDADIVVIRVRPKFVRLPVWPKTRRAQRRLGFQSPYRYGEERIITCAAPRVWVGRQGIDLSAPFDWFPSFSNWVQVTSALDALFEGKPTGRDELLRAEPLNMPSAIVPAPSECRWRVNVTAYNLERVRRHRYPA